MICETSETRQAIPHIAYARNISYRLRMARPAAYPVKKVIGLTAEMAERIRDFRFTHRIDTENEAIRRLIELGLKAAEKQPS